MWLYPIMCFCFRVFYKIRGEKKNLFLANVAIKEKK